jgi:hypothetical protein
MDFSMINGLSNNTGLNNCSSDAIWNEMSQRNDPDTTHYQIEQVFPECVQHADRLHHHGDEVE